MAVRKILIGTVLATAMIGGALFLSLTVSRSADEIDVGTENDVTIGVVSELPDGLTLFTDNSGTLPPMWKVTHGAGTMYMLGSMHAVPVDCYPLDSRVKAAYESSSAVAVEHKNLDAADFLSSSNTTVDTSGVCADGDELKNHLSERQYQLVRSAAESSGFDLEILDKMLPWSVYNNISQISGSDGGSARTDIGIDRVFQIQANIDHKRKYSIESDLSRIELFPKMPEDSLGAMIENELTTDNYNDLYKAWSTGDLDMLFQAEFGTGDLTGEDAAAYERGVTYLLTDRNIAMADKAMEYLDSGETVFFIAGAGHFCGDKGIPELLKSKGCTVERITK
ncbi:MAG: TraB/GumN family protein [Ruminococcus sp.]|nr:TraB/GumN family protein [Ruminococcus sp.]